MGASPDLGARAQPGEGADDGAAADQAALQVAEGADLDPVLHRHAGAEDHVGADGDVLAEHACPRQRKTVSGAIRVAPPAIAAARRRACIRGLQHGELGPAVGAGAARPRRPPRPPRGGRRRAASADDVGQVVLALGVLRPHRVQPAEQVGGGGADHAGVAERRWRARPRSHRPIRPPARRRPPHRPPRGRSGRGRPGASPAGPARPRPGGRPGGAGSRPGSAGCRRRAPRRRRRSPAAAPAACAAAWPVPRRSACTTVACGRAARLERRHVRPDHHHDAVEDLLAGGDQVVEHGPAGDRVQRLGQAAAHAGPETGGEDDGGGHGRLR